MYIYIYTAYVYIMSIHISKYVYIGILHSPIMNFPNCLVRLYPFKRDNQMLVVLLT